ncbi:glycoside hydrolase family 26 protein [Sediminibacterium salmoneum]|uniref:glycoside hydrolase family 26 protein n=1 Tax=Sediminibacterium salmoneum TaxID=426421 RepID=UPI0004787223|nr:glycosyl hydrolase [Sediminibacterium salmoneum]
MRLLILFTLFFSSLKIMFAQEYRTANPNASMQTVKLYNNLFRILPKGILFGHQDDLAYGLGWEYIPGKSAVQDAVGEYPAMYGWELGDLELDATYNLDSVPFQKMKTFIQEGYGRGGVITISWHANNPVTGKNAWDISGNAVSAIVPGGSMHEKYKSWLDKVAGFLLDLKTSGGEFIPVIFRPFHELTGNWFWWCQNVCTPEEYKSLWKFTFDYLTKVKQVNHLLFAYNPEKFENEAQFLQYYPGDEYVDIMSFDFYQYGDPSNNNDFETTLDKRLSILTKLSKERKKLPALAETGFMNIPYAEWFTKKLMKGIGNHAISYVHLWRDGGVVNGSGQYRFAPSQDHFIPVGRDPSFMDFYKLYISDKFIFGNKVQQLNLYK